MASDTTSGTGIGVAVVGCGYWGVNYLRVLRELPQVGTVYAHDPRVLRLKEVVDRFPHVVPLESFDEVLSSPDVAAAIVWLWIFNGSFGHSQGA